MHHNINYVKYISKFLFFRKEEVESQGINFLALVHQSNIIGELRCSKLSLLPFSFKATEMLLPHITIFHRP